MFARESPRAMLLCVPRSKEVVSVGWDRATDTFTIGQWLNGRIRFGDISPDGEHWIYFGYDPRHVRTGGDWRKEGWTALARTPYLKALALYRYDGPGGGGHFNDARSFSVWDQNEEQRMDCFPEGLKRVDGVLSREARRIRDGWRYETRPSTEREKEQWAARERYWETQSSRLGSLARLAGAFMSPNPTAMTAPIKELPGGWILEELTDLGHARPPGRPLEACAYRLTNAKIGAALEFPTWEWADWDPVGNRLTWTDQGLLRAAPIEADGLGATKDLFDARPLKFEAIQAPY